MPQLCTNTSHVPDCLHPCNDGITHVQKKAQAEIDAAIGIYRFSTFDDRGKLPYFSALSKELLCWFPVMAVCFYPCHYRRDTL